MNAEPTNVATTKKPEDGQAQDVKPPAAPMEVVNTAEAEVTEAATSMTPKAKGDAPKKGLRRKHPQTRRTRRRRPSEAPAACKVEWKRNGAAFF